jgi:hypothetical protein
MVRSDTPAKLTAAGWAALYAHGIRTIITLHTYGLEEDELSVTPLYPNLRTVRVAIEDMTDTEFVHQWVNTHFWCTPLYYKDALRRWTERHAAVFSAIAQAQLGGVLFHCKRGHDRIGIIALLLLAFVGVVPDEIIADYALSPAPERDALLAREHSSDGFAMRYRLIATSYRLITNYQLLISTNHTHWTALSSGWSLKLHRIGVALRRFANRTTGIMASQCATG